MPQLLWIIYVFLMLITCMAQDTSTLEPATNTTKASWNFSPTTQNGRGTLEIITGCLLTLIICSWTAQHPDLFEMTSTPIYNGWFASLILKASVLFGEDFKKKHKGMITNFTNRMTKLFMALWGPEILLGWAFIDWRLARKIVRKAQDKDYTLSQTHAHCILMEGIHARRQDYSGQWTDLGAFHMGLPDKDITDSLAEIQAMDSAEIMDKSKADDLVKTIACIQISWLVVQTIARFIENLSISLLELATASCVLFTLVTYMFYWSKPYDMATPFSIDITPRKTTFRRTVLTYMARNISRERWFNPHQGAPDDSSNEETPQTFTEYGWIPGSLRRLEKGNPSSDGPLYEEELHYWLLVTYATATLFGLTHILAWRFSFPTSIEQLLWLISSLISTAIPLCCLLYTLGRGLLSHEYKFGFARVIETQSLSIPSRVLFYTFFALRLFIAVEQVVSLRSQPISLYQAVNWTKLIPHFH